MKLEPGCENPHVVCGLGGREGRSGRPSSAKSPDNEIPMNKPGLYPFVSHAFAAVDEGQVGLLNVGGVRGTMSH
jgi:hypothetical protein